MEQYTPFLGLRQHEAALLAIKQEAVRCAGLDEARRLIRKAREVRYLRAHELRVQAIAQAEVDAAQKQAAAATIRPRQTVGEEKVKPIPTQAEMNLFVVNRATPVAFPSEVAL